MAGVAFTNPVGGVWPLGFVAVAAAGTPVAINTNVGSQSQATSPNKRSRHIRQLIISTPSLAGSSPAPNTKNVYLTKRGQGSGYSRTQTNGIIAIIAPGQTVSFPNGQMFDGGALPTPDDFWLDADVNGEGAFVSVIYG